MTELEMAQRRLYDADALRISNIKMTPGTKRDVSPEQMAQQLNRLLSQLEANDYDLVSDSMLS